MTARKTMAIAGAVLAWVAVPAFAGEKVTIAVHETAFFTATGGGLGGEVVVDAFRRQGIEATFSVMPIKRGIQALFAGEVEAQSPGALFITGDLQQKIEWSFDGKVLRVFAYYRPATPQAALPATPAERAKYFKDHGLSVGLLQGSPSVAPLRAAGVDVYECSDEVQLVRMLRAGRFQYAIGDVYSLAVAVAKAFPQEKAQFGMIFGEVLDSSLAYLKGAPRTAGIKAKFERGLAAGIKDGTFLKLYEKYYGKGNVPAIILPPEIAAQGTKDFDLAKIPSP